DRSLAVEWLAQCIHHSAQQTFPDRHLQELSGGTYLVTFLEPGIVSENHHSYFGFVEVECESSDSMTQVDHLVEHRVAQAFDPRDAITNLAYNTDICFARLAL